MNIYIAHSNQSLKSHLEGVAEICKNNAGKIGFELYGELIGLLHDLGKYSTAFQNYIKSALEMLNPDEDEEFVDAKGLKGKIDHSTAGAQVLWENMSAKSQTHNILAQILTLCLVSHHSGIIDCLKTGANGTTDEFSRRISKDDQKTHRKESVIRAEIMDNVEQILTTPDLLKPLQNMFKSILEYAPQKDKQSLIVQFQLGLLVRFVFSCLIDADRQDTADTENPKNTQQRQNGIYRPWRILIDRYNFAMRQFANRTSEVDVIRQNVSTFCLNAASRPKGIFTLQVPTGGGKTLASLRFALHHGEVHQLERVVFIVPFTSIIDQNADVVRKVLEPSNLPGDIGKIVIEHHSNIGAEKQSWKEKLLTENWDAPVVYTTMVQFLEALFGGGTRSARRMHQLAKAVLIFDEIQTLPIRCVHMFCNAVNFIVDHCGSTVVLCSATQPLLGEVNMMKGALRLSAGNEIVPNISQLFADLKRVDVEDLRKPCGWNIEETTELAIRETNNTGSCLIIVNMKLSARVLFQNIYKKVEHQKAEFKCYHLSTSMCPRHRKKVLRRIKRRLQTGKPTICVSTQLIEAGVDVDFGSVIRFLAGLDSIAQAAGRCNRNGKRNTGNVYIINPSEENIDCLNDIAVGQEKTNRVLDDYNLTPEKYQNDRIGPSLLTWYYKNFFYERESEMSYPISSKHFGRNDTILELLSSNALATKEYARSKQGIPSFLLRQSFMTAAELFHSIDAPTQSVIVKFGDEGKNIVNQLCAAFNVDKQFGLIKQAQQYSINLFPNEYKKLFDAGVLKPVQPETAIWFLIDNRYYSNEFGLVTEPIETSSGEFWNA